MKTLISLFLMLNILSAQAAIEAAVDRNPVNLNDSVQLTFTASDRPDADPDFEPLMVNFDIVNQSHNSQSSWINGHSSEKIQWVLQLMPKHAGTIIIPAIAFGSDKSQPISLEVQDASSSGQINNDAELFLQVEATPKDPYVQSQVLYTLRFYRRVNITQARLDEPTMTDALVQKLGEDSNYNTQLNGVDYVVTERKYAIFPQKSGTLTIAPLTLTAEVVSPRQPNFNGFFNSQITHSQRASSNTITLNVRPAPTAAQNKPWLPAEELQLQQSWSGDITQMQVGEPLTRTISLIAKGATVGVLPELNSKVADPALKNYSDQPTIKELQKPEGVYAMREEKIALIASKAGSYTLPEIVVPWFNTKTQTMQIARIPATTLTVQGGTTANHTQPMTATPITGSQPAPNIALQPASDLHHDDNTLWLWVALFLGLGWLTTLFYFLSPKRRSPKPVAQTKAPSTPDYKKLLKQACQTNDLQLAKQALLQWGAINYHVNSLGTLARYCEDPLRQEIELVNRLLYAQTFDDPGLWQGNLLYQAFNNAQPRASKTGKTPDELLEPLFRL